MDQPKLPKAISASIGRNFNLLFTRATMYHLEHPATVQSLEEFYKIITKGLDILSPVVLIMNREQFFVEEELLDPRINTAKMLSHFKKAGIQSISFEQGMSNPELKGFLKIFTDLNEYPLADAMKTALSQTGITHLKINHVFFQKMTENEAVVSRDQFKEELSDQPEAASGLMDEVFKEVMVEKILLEEMEKNFSLQNLLDDPTKFSQALINTDLSTSTEKTGPGSVLAHQLYRLKEEVKKGKSGMERIDFSALADAVFQMRKDLLEGIEAQKALGIMFANERMIQAKANELSDQVIIRLVKEEYQQGQISIPRLAQIIRRLIPDPGELKRLLPMLKEALMGEGMSLSAFLHLLQALGKELESEGLVQVLQESAEKIGLSGEDLIREIKRDPTEAAELIFLATEIRKGTGDEKVLSDLLVNYVERIGGEMALDTADQKGEEGGKHLRNVISRVESDLVNRLREKMDATLLNSVEQKLKGRIEEVIKQLKSAWILRRISPLTKVGLNKTTILEILEHSVEDDELQEVLEEVLVALRNRGLDETKLKGIFDEILKRKLEQQKEVEKKGLPKGTFTRGNMLFFLKKEVSRAWRYKVPFSAITFSVVNVIPKKEISPGIIKQNEIMKAIMERLVKIMRDTDLVGFWDENKILLMLPMTDENGSHLALQRLLAALQAELFIIKNMPLEIKFAAVATAFHRDKTPTLQAFLRAMETQMKELINPTI